MKLANSKTNDDKNEYLAKYLRRVAANALTKRADGHLPDAYELIDAIRDDLAKIYEVWVFGR